MRNPHFFHKCCHFCWNQNKVSKNDNTYERNEDCATVFLKWTDFRRLYEISFPFTDADSDEWLGIKRFRMPEKKRPQKVVNSHSRPPTFSNGDIFFNFPHSLELKKFKPMNFIFSNFGFISLHISIEIFVLGSFYLTLSNLEYLHNK